MATATSLAQTLTREREALLGTIAWLSDAALDQKGTVGEWSIKDVLAHLAVWEHLVLQTVRERLAAGSTPAARSASVAAAEALDHERKPLRAAASPTEQVLALEDVRADLLWFIGRLGEETLTRARPWPEWEGTVAEYLLVNVRDHEREYHRAIRAAVTTLAPAAEYAPGARASRELAITHVGSDAAGDGHGQ